jgi:hypothetical protein
MKTSCKCSIAVFVLITVCFAIALSLYAIPAIINYQRDTCTVLSCYIDTCKSCTTDFDTSIETCDYFDCAKETVSLKKYSGQWEVTGSTQCHPIGREVTCYYERDRISATICYEYQTSIGAVMTIIFPGLIWIACLFWFIIEISRLTCCNNQVKDQTEMSIV